MYFTVPHFLKVRLFTFSILAQLAAKAVEMFKKQPVMARNDAIWQPIG